MDSQAAVQSPDTKRQMLRHSVATLAYRGGKAMRGASAGFAEYRASEGGRTPGQILAHLGDLLEWALSMSQGKQKWNDSPALSWDAGTERFFRGLEALDAYLASEAPLHVSPEKLFQGPVADALTHVGQISMLRRMAGEAVRGENFYVADIAAGRVGSEQAAPVREF